MGSISARKLERIVGHVRIVRAVEAMGAAEGLEVGGRLQGGGGVRAALGTIRRAVATLEGDGTLHGDMAACEGLLENGALRASVEAAATTLE